MCEMSYLLLARWGEAVGIYVLSSKEQYLVRNEAKEPVEYNANLRHSSIFKLLRKKNMKVY